MRIKNGIFLAAAVFVLTGCASMYDAMGLVTKDSLEARDKRLQALEAQNQDVSTQVKDLSTEVAAAKDAAKKVAEIEALMKSLQGRVDQLPQQTLKKLADVLQKAVTETSPQP